MNRIRNSCEHWFIFPCCIGKHSKLYLLAVSHPKVYFHWKYGEQWHFLLYWPEIPISIQMYQACSSLVWVMVLWLSVSLFFDEAHLLFVLFIVQCFTKMLISLAFHKCSGNTLSSPCCLLNMALRILFSFVCVFMLFLIPFSLWVYNAIIPLLSICLFCSLRKLYLLLFPVLVWYAFCLSMSSLNHLVLLFNRSFII